MALAPSQRKVAEMMALQQLLQVASVQVVHCDALKAVARFGAGTFTHVLLDGPCSGIGRRPSLRPLASDRGGLHALVALQRSLLRAGFPFYFIFLFLFFFKFSVQVIQMISIIF